jgi:hypothetical protein
MQMGRILTFFFYQKGELRRIRNGMGSITIRSAFFPVFSGGQQHPHGTQSIRAWAGNSHGGDGERFLQDDTFCIVG